MSVLDQIRELEKQKQALLKKAHDEALKIAQDAVAQLNELGHSYKLTGGAAKASGKRRTGIRQDVEAQVKRLGGASRSEILEAMNAKGDKRAEQSISNALAALKKSGAIKQDEAGHYTT